ncbi:MAG: hypothetical protein ACW98D_11685 [Promethearchaeota archaeon]|jgi:hypothetical protein
MLILKHVEYEIPDINKLNMLLDHLNQTTSKFKGISFNDIFFSRNKKKFVLLLECESEDVYLMWRKICPPPSGAKDWYEVYLSKREYFS